MKPFKIGNREIGPDQPPFIIAEMSGNHNHKLARARAIVEAAAEAGADAIKLQTYTADTLTLNSDKDDFKITDPQSPWYGYNLYKLYEKAHTPWAWHEELFALAKEKNIICFSSPFDVTAVDFLEKLGAPAYKIASFECVHIPLIKYASSTGKPLIISTGLATEEEIGEAVAAARSTGNEQVMLLKCTSNYPAEPKDANLATIADMQKRFGVHVGLSDHTLGTKVSADSVKYYGAVAIEKHVTLNENEDGVDEAFSLKPAELKALVEDCRAAWKSRTNEQNPNETHGNILYGGMPSEQNSRIFRVSLYFKNPVKKGEVITENHVRVARPGYGIKPKYFGQVLGSVAQHDAEFGDRVTEQVIGRSFGQ